MTRDHLPATPPLRVLQVHTYLRSEMVNPRSGGKSRVSLMLTRYLLEAGHEVALYSWPERIWGDAVPFSAGNCKAALALPTLAVPTLRRILPDIIRLRQASFPTRENRSRWVDAHFLEGLRSAIRRFRPDILHCHQTGSDIPALLNALEKPVPAILTHHSGRSGPQLQVYDRIIFLSRSMQEEVCRESHYPLEKSSVVYYPILEEFQHGEIHPAAERLGLVSVGVLTKAKGVDLLLEAYRWSAVLRKHPLILCGAGEDEPEFREFVRRHRLPVTFQGRISAVEMRRILSRAQLLVNPSRMEGFSVALLEALACGTPVIGWASQVDELTQWWNRPVGFPFDARIQSAADLAVLLERTLHDPLLRTAERRKLSQLARVSFSMTRYGAEMVNHYRSLLESGR